MIYVCIVTIYIYHYKPTEMIKHAEITQNGDQSKDTIPIQSSRALPGLDIVVSQ